MPKKLGSKGQGLVEYAIILAIVAIIVIVLLNILHKKQMEAEQAEIAAQQESALQTTEPEMVPDVILELPPYDGADEGPLQVCEKQGEFKNVLARFENAGWVEIEMIDTRTAEVREYVTYAGDSVHYLRIMQSGESELLNGTLIVRNCLGGLTIESDTNIEWHEYVDGTKLGIVSAPQTVKFETESFDHFRECKADFASEGRVEIDSFGYIERSEVDEAFAGIGQPFAVNVHLKGYYPLKLNYGLSTDVHPNPDHVTWWTDQQGEIRYQFAGGWDYHEWEGEILSAQLPTGQQLLVRFPSASNTFQYTVVADKNCNPVQPPSSASEDIPQVFLPIVWGYKDACMRGDGNSWMLWEGAPHVYGSISVSGNWRDESTYVLEVISESGTFDVHMGVDKQRGWINGLTGGQLWEYNYQSKTMTIGLGDTGMTILVYIPWFRVSDPLPVMYRVVDSEFIRKYCG